MEIDFDRVWKRVKSAEPVDEGTQLTSFIQAELRDAADYEELAGRTGAVRVRKLFLALSRVEKSHAKKLQTAEYLLFGGHAAHSMNRQSGNERILSALRSRYAGELQRAEAYSAAAGNVSHAHLKKLYGELADEERRHAEKLCNLLEELL